MDPVLQAWLCRMGRMCVHFTVDVTFMTWILQSCSCCFSQSSDKAAITAPVRVGLYCEFLQPAKTILGFQTATQATQRLLSQVAPGRHCAVRTVRRSEAVAEPRTLVALEVVPRVLRRQPRMVEPVKQQRKGLANLGEAPSLFQIQALLVDL